MHKWTLMILSIPLSLAVALSVLGIGFKLILDGKESHMKRYILFLILVLVFSLNLAVRAQTDSDESPGKYEQIFDQDVVLNGKITAVQDGDTCTLLYGGVQEYIIRLAGIDAPELGQDFGQAAKDNLAKLILEKRVSVKVSKTDNYGRFVGKMTADGIDINLAQIVAGLAWHYKENEKTQPEADRQAYAEAEIKASQNKTGLWGQSFTAPWEYRKNEAAVRKAKADEAAKNVSSPTVVSTPSTSSGRTYIRGSRGGCYYINSKGDKEYVDKSLCN